MSGGPRPGAWRPRARGPAANVPLAIFAVALAVSGGTWLLTNEALEILTATRAYVGGEGLWSKSQKEAVLALKRYAESGREEDFERYSAAIAVPLGDRKARVALIRVEPDVAAARRGFLEGRNHPEDVPRLVSLFLRFRRVPLMARAIEIWTRGDELVEVLAGTAGEIRREVRSGSPDRGRLRALVARVDDVNALLTPLEDEFSATLGEAARWVKKLAAGGVGGTSFLLLLGAAAVARRILREEARAAESLRASEERYRTVSESAIDGILSVDRDGRIRYANAAAGGIFGVEPGDLTGHLLAERIPGAEVALFSRSESIVNGASRPPRQGTARFTGRHIDGRDVPLELSFGEVRKDGRRQYAVVVRDISAQLAAEERIRASLREKEVLVREIHHRVKNNLQVVSSLLSLASARVTDPEALRTFQESRDRIRAMALVHVRLYQASDLSRLEAGEYLGELAQSLIGSYELGRAAVALEIEAEEISLDADSAISCGLLLNELVSNALKHAFPGERRGTIRVAVRRQGASILLEVGDDGVGLPAGFDLGTTRTLGCVLISSLSRQLGGEARYLGGRGTTVRVAFPADRGAAAPLLPLPAEAPPAGSNHGPSGAGTGAHRRGRATTDPSDGSGVHQP